MACSENVVDCHAENLVWTEDALGFHFPCTKTDQLGKRSDAIWHVYATPNSPSTCCHLALARYLFANPGILLNNDSSRGSNKLFPGSNQYERFMKVFHRVMRNNEEAFQQSLGIWDRIQQGRVLVVWQHLGQLYHHQLYQFVFEQCGVWVAL